VRARRGAPQPASSAVSYGGGGRYPPFLRFSVVKTVNSVTFVDGEVLTHELSPPGSPIRGADVCVYPRLDSHRDPLARLRDRREYGNLQRRQRAAASSPPVPGSRAARDSLEPVAGPRHRRDWFSTAQYFDIRSAAWSFEQVALAIGSNLNLTGDGNRNGSVRSAFHRICFPRSAPTRRLDVRSPTPMPPKARPAPPSCITARGCGGTGEIRRPSNDRSSSTASLIRSSAVWRVRCGRNHFRGGRLRGLLVAGELALCVMVLRWWPCAPNKTAWSGGV